MVIRPIGPTIISLILVLWIFIAELLIFGILRGIRCTPESLNLTFPPGCHALWVHTGLVDLLVYNPPHTDIRLEGYICTVCPTLQEQRYYVTSLQT